MKDALISMLGILLTAATLMLVTAVNHTGCLKATRDTGTMEIM